MTSHELIPADKSAHRATSVLHLSHAVNLWNLNRWYRNKRSPWMSHRVVHIPTGGSMDTAHPPLSSSDMNGVSEVVGLDGATILYRVL